jgi:RNA polymerase sigma-70 factor (ECF subfamily)
MPNAATVPETIAPAAAAGSTTGSFSYLRDPDVQLMLRVAEGDDDAFAELVQAYQDRLVGIFRHLLQDREAAEDLAQETFLRVFQARRTYAPTAKFSTWLFCIANNLASNVRRGNSRRRTVSFAGTGDDGTGGRPEEWLLADKSALMPTRQLDRRELQEVVRQALGDLSDRHRMALLLHKYEEMSYADIAAAMETTEPAVKSLLARARESLRDRLEAYVR